MDSHGRKIFNGVKSGTTILFILLFTLLSGCSWFGNSSNLKSSLVDSNNLNTNMPPVKIKVTKDPSEKIHNDAQQAEKDNNDALALEQYKLVIEASKYYTEAQNKIQELTKKIDSQKLYEEAVKAEQDGDYQVAIEKYGKIDSTSQYYAESQRKIQELTEYAKLIRNSIAVPMISADTAIRKAFDAYANALEKSAEDGSAAVATADKSVMALFLQSLESLNEAENLYNSMKQTLSYSKAPNGFENFHRSISQIVDKELESIALIHEGMSHLDITTTNQGATSNIEATAMLEVVFSTKPGIGLKKLYNPSTSNSTSITTSKTQKIEKCIDTWLQEMPKSNYFEANSFCTGYYNAEE